jgi:hypothetical protein
LTPNIAVSEKIGMASTAMSLRHHLECQRFQMARAMPANAAGTHHHVASATGPPNELSRFTATQSVAPPTIAPTMSTTNTVSTHAQPSPRPSR